jgi:CRISPR-associated protein Cas6
MQNQTSLTSTLDTLSIPYIVVRFPVQGRQLPADHGYALYSAITNTLPALHGAPWLGIELISGIPWSEGLVMLPTRGATFRLRIPAERFSQVLPLAGKRLEIKGNPIRLGIPIAQPLIPASSLYARIVTIKKFTEAEPFLEAARRQLVALGLNATLELPADEQGRHRRRVINIQGKTVVGFSLAVHGLSDDHSLLLQSRGIGGRRAMGCGIFNPIVKAVRTEEEVFKRES